MRKKGLEPPRREAPDPKSGAATNYATSALGFQQDCKSKVSIEISKHFFQEITIKSLLLRLPDI